MFGLLFQRIRHRNTAADKLHTSSHKRLTVHNAGKSVSGKSLKIRNLISVKLPFFSFFQNCLCQRMFTFLFQRKGKSQKLLFRKSLCRKNISNFRLTAGNGSCFIKSHNLYFSCFFKRYGCFKKNPVFGAHAVSYHNGNRSGKSQCAGAADNKNRNSPCKSIAKGLSCKKPHNSCNYSNGDNGRHKDPGNPVCDFCNRSLGGCSVADHFYNLG